MDKKVVIGFLASMGGWFFTGAEPFLRSVLLIAQLATALFSAVYFWRKHRELNKNRKP